MISIEKQIMRHEGFRSTAYRCSAGKLTIGYGRNLEDKGISRSEARTLLRNDIAECEADLYKIFGKVLWRMGNDRRCVLLDMRFNLGYAGFRGFKRMIRAVKREHFAIAAYEMKDSVWYGQVGNRSKTLYEMMWSDK